MVRHLQQCRVKERGMGLQWYQSKCQARRQAVRATTLDSMQGVPCQRLGSQQAAIEDARMVKLTC